MKRTFFLPILFCAFLIFVGTANAYIWGVNPAAETGSEIVNIDPFTGSILDVLAAPVISSDDTEIGLAGWSGALYYTNADQANGTVYNINPLDGSYTSFNLSGGWEVDGLGYYADGSDAYLYTSGCSVNDVHRYEAADGSSPTFYYSNIDDPQAMAGDNGGRIFSYGDVDNVWGIYEIDPLTNMAATFLFSSPSDSIVGMAFDGTYLYLSDTDNMLYTLDLGGEILSTLELGYTLYALGSTEGSPAPVPEPGTIVLMGLGLVGLAGMGRKKLLKK